MSTPAPFAGLRSCLASATLFAFIAGAFTLGCSRNEDTDSNRRQVPPSHVIKPKSGGELTLIPAGSFTMGDANGNDDEKPAHTVSVSSFYIDTNLVTQEIYERIMRANPSKVKDPQNPVEKTQWFDAVRFCNECSKLDGLTPCYDEATWECNFTASGYRLPTEAEWEYACRAGSIGKYCFGDDETKLGEYAWFRQNSKGKPHPVGQKSPNALGLFDMHGNVWQWCNDWYAESYSETPKENPRGPAKGEKRVLRGGAYSTKLATDCRSASRQKEFPRFGDACFGADSYGFRRVCGEATNKELLNLRAKP